MSSWLTSWIPSFGSSDDPAVSVSLPVSVEAQQNSPNVTVETVIPPINDDLSIPELKREEIIPAPEPIDLPVDTNENKQLIPVEAVEPVEELVVPPILEMPVPIPAVPASSSFECLMIEAKESLWANEWPECKKEPSEEERKLGEEISSQAKTIQRLTRNLEHSRLLYQQLNEKYTAKFAKAEGLRATLEKEILELRVENQALRKQLPLSSAHVQLKKVNRKTKKQHKAETKRLREGQSDRFRECTY